MQITLTRPFRRIILQCSQIFFTDGLTFTVIAPSHSRRGPLLNRAVRVFRFLIIPYL